jgi:hypothetical protein
MIFDSRVVIISAVLGLVAAVAAASDHRRGGSLQPRTTAGGGVSAPRADDLASELTVVTIVAQAWSLRAWGSINI